MAHTNAIVNIFLKWTFFLLKSVKAINNIGEYIFHLSEANDAQYQQTSDRIKVNSNECGNRNFLFFYQSTFFRKRERRRPHFCISATHRINMSKKCYKKRAIKGMFPLESKKVEEVEEEEGILAGAAIKLVNQKQKIMQNSRG